MLMNSETWEQIFFYWDETRANLIVMSIIGLLLGTAVFIVLSSYNETPETELNLSDLNQEYKENATCIPPYRDKACYPTNNYSEVNKPANFSTIPDNKTVMKERCQQRNGTLVYGNQTNETISESGVFCKL